MIYLNIFGTWVIIEQDVVGKEIISMVFFLEKGNIW